MRVINLISTGQFLNQVVACGCIKPSVVSAYPWRSSRMRPLQQRVLQIWYVLRVILRQDWYFASAPPPGAPVGGTSCSLFFVQTLYEHLPLGALRETWACALFSYIILKKLWTKIKMKSFHNPICQQNPIFCSFNSFCAYC